MLVLLIPASWHVVCNRGDSSSSQQLDTTETKLRTSNAVWNRGQRHGLSTDFSVTAWVDLIVSCLGRPATRPCWPPGDRGVCGRVCISCRRPIGSLSGCWWEEAPPSEDTHRRTDSNIQTGPGARCTPQTDPEIKWETKMVLCSCSWPEAKRNRFCINVYTQGKREECFASWVCPPLGHLHSQPCGGRWWTDPPGRVWPPLSPGWSAGSQWAKMLDAEDRE